LNKNVRKEVKIQNYKLSENGKKKSEDSNKYNKTKPRKKSEDL